MDTWKNFKQMPLLLKVLFVGSVLSLIGSIATLVGAKPINFTYFGSEFPQNFPFVWHLYNVLIGCFGIYVFLKRSYSLLVKYTVYGVVVLIITLANSVYSMTLVTVQTQLVLSAVIYGISYLLGVLIMIYMLRQKKYFNKP